MSKICPNCEEARAIKDYPFCDDICRLVYLMRLEQTAYHPKLQTVKTGEELTVLKYPEYIAEMKAFFKDPNRDVNHKLKPLSHVHFGKSFLT